mmetsp:Transcript_3577/g.6979  ORF Transcript_3577/g.6979 Transcript_3577/m.6979 type:complete len:380 (+) Transcript_3577:71-1210(+)
MVLSALSCGCFQGLATQHGKTRAKHDRIRDEAAACRNADVQAKIKAFHEAKQRQEREANELQELERAAKNRAAADAEKLNHAELVGRLEKAKADIEMKERQEAAKEAAPQLQTDGAPPHDVRCWPLEDSRDAEQTPEAAKQAAAQLKNKGTSVEDARCLPLGNSNLLLDNARIEKAKAELEVEKEQIEGGSRDAAQLNKEGTSPEDVRCLPLEGSNLSLDSTRIDSPWPDASDDAHPFVKEFPTACKGVPGGMQPVAEGQHAKVVLQGNAHDGAQMTMEHAAEDQHAKVVLQGQAHDGVQTTPQPRKKDPGFEPAMEAAPLKESSAKSSALENRPTCSELDDIRRRVGGAGFACKATIASCAVMVIAVAWAFHATSRAS